MNQKGFTLVELLVAATIIGILAVFATTQYRNAAAETRWTQAKAKADQIAHAVYRAQLDYSNLIFTADKMDNSTSTTCGYPPSGSVLPNTLIPCGYLENSGWSNEYFEYYVCIGNSSCGSEENALAMVQVRANAKLPTAYQSYKYYAKVVEESREDKGTGE